MACWKIGTPTFPCCRRSSPFSKRKAGRARPSLRSLRALPPVARPGKMFYAAQNFQEHVDEMIRAGMSPASGPKFTGEKSTSQPYLFLKAPSCLAGAYDDIAIPRGMKKIDWEAEIALRHRQARQAHQGRARARSRRRLHDRPTTCPAATCRSAPTGRALRSDWLGGKSHDNFAPMGPFLVPRAFVPDHMNLFIRLTVNGEIKQNGNTSQFIFTPEEQIEYASDILIARNRRLLQLRHLRRRRPGHQHLPQGRRRDGDRDRESRQDAQSLRRGGSLEHDPEKWIRFSDKIMIKQNPRL